MCGGVLLTVSRWGGVGVEGVDFKKDLRLRHSGGVVDLRGGGLTQYLRYCHCSRNLPLDTSTYQTKSCLSTMTRVAVRSVDSQAKNLLVNRE